MKTILITGAAGLLGSNLINFTVCHPDCRIIAADIDKCKIPIGSHVTAISNDELFVVNSLEIDTVINCAFARGNVVPALVSALSFNEKLILKLKELGAKSILNISSQGLYKSLEPGQFASEDSEIEPYDQYAFAKFAQERLFTSHFGEKVTNIRMASLSANARFLAFFVDSVIQGKDLSITAPYQYVSFLDVLDAAEGIIKLTGLPTDARKSVYNLGSEKQYSILEIARMTNRIGQELGYRDVEINVCDNGKQSAIVMDCSKIKHDTGWAPKIQMEDMIKSLFQKHGGRK
jgi:nucleoside-diphosphate-sugar epimerase